MAPHASQDQLKLQSRSGQPQQGVRALQLRGRPQQQQQQQQQEQQQQQQRSQQAPVHASQQQEQRPQGSDERFGGPMKQQQDNAARRQVDLQRALEQAREGLAGLLGQRALLMRAVRRCTDWQAQAEEQSCGEHAISSDAAGGAMAPEPAQSEHEAALRPQEVVELARLLEEGAAAGEGKGAAATPSAGWLAALAELVSQHAAEAQAEFQQLAQSYLILTQQLGIPPCAVPEAAWRAAAPGHVPPAAPAPTSAGMSIPSDLEQVGCRGSEGWRCCTPARPRRNLPALFRHPHTTYTWPRVERSHAKA
jgi:hypothetical protein